MFIVAIDLSEAQRGRLVSSLSLRRMNVTAYTLEAGRIVFVSVNRHGGHTSRTFIVEDCSEDDFGHWATDEVTGEQGYIDDERSYFWAWDDSEYA